jgi:hypothetical protein
MGQLDWEKLSECPRCSTPLSHRGWATGFGYTRGPVSGLSAWSTEVGEATGGVVLVLYSMVSFKCNTVVVRCFVT